MKPDDQRSFLYKPSFELLSYLGVSKIEDIPEYAKVKRDFEIISEQSAKEEENAKNSLDDNAQNIENTDNGDRNE